MKILFALPLLFASSAFAFAFAADTPCMIKQKNAASYSIAQKFAKPVQGVAVLDFQNGAWTKMSGNNTGSDQVRVGVAKGKERCMTVTRYEVFAKQIEDSADCTILKLKEVPVPELAMCR